VGDHVAVRVGGGDLGEGELRRRTVRLWHSRSDRLAAPVYWMVIVTVDARVPLSKSWFDHAAAAPAVSITDAITPPWK
jgi:hypothetical protein